LLDYWVAASQRWFLAGPVVSRKIVGWQVAQDAGEMTVLPAWAVKPVIDAPISVAALLLRDYLRRADECAQFQEWTPGAATLRRIHGAG
jgi:hypothetical protein